VSLTVRDIGRLPLPGTDVPGSFAFTPDGSALTYLHAGDDTLVRSLWWHDLASGQRTLLLGPQAGSTDEESLPPEERLRRERTRTSTLGVTEHAWARDAMTLVVPVAGRVLVASGTTWPTTPLSLPGIEDAQSAAPSPDGRNVAIVRGGDLWLSAPDGRALRRLTTAAEPGVFSGLAEYAAAEELDRFDGLWWSRDSSRLAFAHVDERRVPPFFIADLAAAHPSGEEQRYPFAGGPNALVTLRVLDVAGGTASTVDIDMAPDDYLARVVAEPTGGWLVAVLPRDQRRLRWLRVDRAGAARELWVESAEPWINLDDATRVLADGRILRAPETGGFRHLELRLADGSLDRRLPAGSWCVTSVAGIDEQGGRVLVVGTRDGTTERHLYAVRLDASSPDESPERLTPEPGWHEVVADGHARRWVDSWSSPEHGPRSVIRGADGSTLPLQDALADATRVGVDPPRLLELRAADGLTKLDALFYPAEGAGPGPAPCVVWVYGGPHAQNARRSWDASVHPLRRYLAQHGAAVLVVDNRGSANRGLAFEAALRGQLGGVEVDDQVAAVRQLAEMGWVDLGRVAITGGSYGGFMTLMAMLRHPDIFRVGVAVSP
jgi:dipeptidyl-peptidase-4